MNPRGDSAEPPTLRAAPPRPTGGWPPRRQSQRPVPMRAMPNHRVASQWRKRPVDCLIDPTVPRWIAVAIYGMPPEIIRIAHVMLPEPVLPAPLSFEDFLAPQRPLHWGKDEYLGKGETGQMIQQGGVGTARVLLAMAQKIGRPPLRGCRSCRGSPVFAAGSPTGERPVCHYLSGSVDRQVGGVRRPFPARPRV